MKRRESWLPWIGVLALGACSGPGVSCAPTNSTEGSLGHGNFAYECSSGSSDFACQGVQSATAPLPSAIAVGASFSLQYTPNGGDEALGLESTTPSILNGASLDSTDASFSFGRAGNAGVVVTASAGILDFTELTGEDVATLSVANSVVLDDPSCMPSLPDGGADAGTSDAGTGVPPVGTFANVTVLVGRTVNVALFPVDATGATLAGAIAPMPTSLDDTIVSVTPGGGVVLCGQSPGSAVVELTLGGKTFSLGVQVTP
jgi:hypothetical protein